MRFLRAGGSTDISSLASRVTASSVESIRIGHHDQHSVEALRIADTLALALDSKYTPRAVLEAPLFATITRTNVHNTFVAVAMKGTRYVLYLHHGTRLSGKADIGHILAPQESGNARGP